jgi:hypothetical protein
MLCDEVDEVCVPRIPQSRERSGVEPRYADQCHWFTTVKLIDQGCGQTQGDVCMSHGPNTDIRRRSIDAILVDIVS